MPHILEECSENMCALSQEYENRYARWFELFKTVHLDPKERHNSLFTSMRPPQIDGIFSVMRSGRLRGFVLTRLWDTDDQDFLLSQAAILLLQAMEIDLPLDPRSQLHLTEGSHLKSDAQALVESAFCLNSEFCQSLTPHGKKLS